MLTSNPLETAHQMPSYQLNEPSPLTVKVWGDLACFTRPEMKVERVSYPVITPSAARGVLEAIFWKPEFRWAVREVQVLRPIRYFSILRNELNARQSYTSTRRWKRKGEGFYADEHRTQRHTLALRDVAYIIKAQLDVKSHIGEDPAKYRDQFRRRVNSGRCFATPYLGCREFSASFSYPTEDDVPLDINEDLGTMLLDLEYSPHGSGAAKPRFFHARLVRGIMQVPGLDSPETQRAA